MIARVICLMLTITFPCSFATAEIVYSAPGMKKGDSLYELLVYSITADHKSGSHISWGDKIIERDGSPIMFYFKSRNEASDYSICIKYDYVTNLDDWKTRYACNAWFDTKLHSIEILSSIEAKRIKKFTIHNYDVRGKFVNWDGNGDPPNMLSHEKTSYEFVDVTPLSSPVSSTVRHLDRNERAILAFATCGLLYLGEQACSDMLEAELGKTGSSVSCSAAIQLLSDGKIDPADLLIGTAADFAMDSDSLFWQVAGGAAKVALFKKCYDEKK